MKFLVYSTGSGLVAGAFLLLMMTGRPAPADVDPPEAQPVRSHVHIVKLPVITYPPEVIDAQE